MKFNINPLFLNLLKGVGVFLCLLMPIVMSAQSYISGPTQVVEGTTYTYEISGSVSNLRWEVPVAATTVSSNSYSVTILWDAPPGNYTLGAEYNGGEYTSNEFRIFFYVYIFSDDILHYLIVNIINNF